MTTALLIVLGAAELAAMLALLPRAIVEPADDDRTGGDTGYFGG